VSSARIAFVRTSPRTQPAKSPLSKEAVLEAGLRVLRAKGIDAVTMRAVAAELETGAASLYVYVANRQELLDEIFDLVTGQIDLGDEPDPDRWREQLEGLLTRILEMMERYHGIARVPLANVPTGPNAVAVAERVIALLRAGKVDDRSIAWFVDIVFLFVNATAYETSIYLDAGVEQETIDDDIRAGFERLDPSAYPHVFSMLGLLTSGSGEERFRFGLRLMIEGLLHAPPPKTG
jgi:AcrR family transcriptional regulator